MPLPEAVGPALVAAAGLFALALAASALTLGPLLKLLSRRQVLDRPNARSSHDAPVPRGGGIAVIGTVILLALALEGLARAGRAPDGLPLPWLGAALALALVSFRDDLKPLPATLRFAAHVAAVVAGLPAVLAFGPVTQGLLPGWADAAVAGLAWVGFVNFFNFMDGIDGLAAVETTAIGLGLAALGAIAGAWLWLGPGALVAGAALGFLYWNRPPARVFLGDVGSVPLGYLLGGLLLSLAAAGFWAAALILPAYYLADAGITLLRRLLKREKVWQAHRDHFYQRAARALGRHGPVTGAVALADAGLVLAAVGAAFRPLIALSVAVLIVGALILWMARR